MVGAAGFEPSAPSCVTLNEGSYLGSTCDRRQSQLSVVSLPSNHLDLLRQNCRILIPRTLRDATGESGDGLRLISVRLVFRNDAKGPQAPLGWLLLRYEQNRWRADEGLAHSFRLSNLARDAAKSCIFYAGAHVWSIRQIARMG